MRRYKDNRKYNEFEIVKCNKCGKSIKFDKDILKEGAFSVEYRWGYFSDKDGECHSFDLCENCYDEFIRGFLINVDTVDENELI